MLNPGPISDAGWNAIAYEGLMRIKDELGVEVRQKQSDNPSEWKTDLRNYARSGCQLIFGHGFEYWGPINEVAPLFPDTVFISSGGGEGAGPNYAFIDFMLEEATYLAGIVAGAITKTNKIGLIAGQEIPPVRRSNNALMHGARLANPAVSFAEAFLGNWEDAGKAKEQALAQIREGADLIYQNADKAGMGAFQAAAQSPGVYAFGSNKNQNDIDPERIVASAVMDVPHGFVLVAKSVRDGRFQAEPIHLGTKDGVIYLAINEKLRGLIPQSALDLVEREKARILSGELDVNALGTP
ncbi:MAG: Purine-binding protein precursor [candidate division BRC1 bacterium ADurb.BinA364]|nr:MAG: Purine-binding protein precursor [candidate division BRC1 bacterium ADurb.BinA364]